MNFGILSNGRHSAFYRTHIEDFISEGIFDFSSNLVDVENANNTRYTVYFEYITSTSVTNLKVIEISDITVTFDWSADPGALNHLNNGDYLHVSNFSTQPNNNGLWKIINDPVANTIIAIKMDDIIPVMEQIGDTALCNENPFESPGAIIVENFNKEDINGEISEEQIFWNFDFTHNIQGGRISNEDVAVVIVAISCDEGQYTKINHTITKSIGQNIKIDAIDELNFELSA